MPLCLSLEKSINKKICKMSSETVSMSDDAPDTNQVSVASGSTGSQPSATPQDSGSTDFEIKLHPVNVGQGDCCVVRFHWREGDHSKVYSILVDGGYQSNYTPYTSILIKKCFALLFLFNR